MCRMTSASAKASPLFALGLSGALVLLANGFTLFIAVTGIDRQFIYVAWAVGMVAITGLVARRAARLSWAEIGLAGAGYKSSAAVGAVVGLVLAAPPLLFMIFPFLLTAPPRYHEIQTLDAAGLIWRLGVEASIATALTEEFLFRGVLQALFTRVLTGPLALVSTNIVFALWHLAANALTLEQNTLALPFVPAALAQWLGYAGSLVAVGIGGFVFSLLRERTHHLAGSIAAHWVSVAAMTILIYVQ